MKKKNDNRKVVIPPNVINEFKPYEIEEKFQLDVVPKLSFFHDIKNVIKKSKKFAFIPELENFCWVFHFDYYAYKTDNSIRQALVIVYHPSTPRFWVKTKGQMRTFLISNSEKKFCAWVVQRKEKEYSENRVLSDQDVNLIIKRREDEIGRKVFLLGRLTREKYYTFLKNINTGRTFSVSLDFCHASGKTMSQLEIEYKWRDDKFRHNFKDVDSLISEYRIFSQILLSSTIGFRLMPTKLTKFQWLLKISNGKKLLV